MSDNNKSSNRFAKTTNFKWLAIGALLFIFICFIMPLPDSMIEKAGEVFPTLSKETQDRLGSPDKLAINIKVIIALLAMCVIFFATVAIPMAAVALVIGLVQVIFGITAPEKI